ncbi:hypothetical protein DV515_00000624, partial [Chloebia gouldiae]
MITRLAVGKHKKKAMFWNTLALRGDGDRKLKAASPVQSGVGFIMEMCDPAKESVSGHPLPRLSTRRSEGPRVPHSRCSVSPSPSSISARAVGGQSPDPTLPLQPDPRTPAAPRPLQSHAKSSSPTPGSGEEKGEPPWVRDWFLEVEGCHTKLRPRAESLLPQGGKAGFSKKKKKKNQKTMERDYGEQGVSPGGMLRGARLPLGCGGNTPAVPRGDGDNGMAPGVRALQGSTGGTARLSGAEPELAHGGHGQRGRTGTGAPVRGQDGAEEVGAVGTDQLGGVVSDDLHHGAVIVGAQPGHGGRRVLLLLLLLLLLGYHHRADLAHLAGLQAAGGGAEPPAGAGIYGNTHHNSHKKMDGARGDAGLGAQAAWSSEEAEAGSGSGTAPLSTARLETAWSRLLPSCKALPLLLLLPSFLLA